MPEGVTAPQYYAIQLLAIRREQGRIGELEAARSGARGANPERLAWRAALATLLCDTGRHDEARPSWSAGGGRLRGRSRPTATG